MCRMGHTAFICMFGGGRGVHVAMAFQNIGEFSVKFLIIDISKLEISKILRFFPLKNMNTFYNAALTNL